MRITEFLNLQFCCRVLNSLLAISSAVFSFSPGTQAQTETVIHSFSDGTTDGGFPGYGLTFDTAGNLWGTANTGGPGGEGEVFQLTPASGGGWTYNTIFGFTQWITGRQPSSPIVFDSLGNAYGTTMFGGNSGGCGAGYFCGNVFQLSPSSNGWIETVLYSFTGGADGGEPTGTLAIDAAGNLYGTASIGGRCRATSIGCGVVFELSPTSSGWTESVLYTFRDKRDGSTPTGGVTRDAAGNLYGTTTAGGDATACPATISGCGVVFELSPSSSGWTESVLHAFTGGSEGAHPTAALTLNAAGGFYGTTSSGGGVFQLSPAQTGTWKFRVIATLQELSSGVNPIGELALDAAGNIYGTTMIGGNLNDCGNFIGCGAVYKLSPNAKGRWIESVLYAFPGAADGATPSAGVVLDPSGHIFGETESGGSLTTCGFTQGCGVLFEITP